MISSSKYNKKTTQISATRLKRQLNCQKQPKSPHLPKIKPRVDRQKHIKKNQIQNLKLVKNNDLFQQPIHNEDLSVFSKKNKEKTKLSIKRNQQYLQKVNQNGFSKCPPPLTQLIPPILIFSMIFQVILVTSQCMESHEFYISLGLMSLLMLLVGYFWYKTTSICPTDPIQIQHQQFIKCPQNSSFQPHKYKHFCNLCQTCTGQNSFHCNKCNRCVEYFDHHCRWINNCIGSRNYIEFIHLLVWTQLFMVFFFVWNGILIHRIVNQNEQLPKIFWYAVIMNSLALVPFMALSALLFLHLYLIAAKRTTLEMILQNRKKHKIYPQNSSYSLAYKKKSIYIPDESPINSPANFTQNSTLHKINDQHNQSLLKFMKNLTNNLKIAKKPSQQIQPQSKFEQTQKKINFKPTILKKNTQLQKNQTNISTEKNIKFKIQPGQMQRNKQNQNNLHFQDASEINLQFKNTTSQVKFQTKSQIFEETLKSKTDCQIEKENYFAETIQTSIKNSKQPRKLTPINKIQTEKKLRFRPNNKNINSQTGQFNQRLQNYQSTVKKNYIFDESQNRIQVTKLFQVNSLQKQSTESKY